MSRFTHHSLKDVLADPALRESLIVTVLVVALSAGTVVVAAWLWVLRHSLSSAAPLEGGWLVVCGHALEDGRPSADYRARLARAGELAHRHSRLQLLIAGGGMPSEAAAGLEWLRRHMDIDPGRVVLEESSEDTFDNLRHAREIVGTGTPIAIVTSRYHLGRILMFASHLGMKAQPVPAEPARRSSLRHLAMEFTEALYVCWFAIGWCWAKLARRQRLLDRTR